MNTVANKIRQITGCATEFGTSFALNQQLALFLGDYFDDMWSTYHSRVLDKLESIPEGIGSYQNKEIEPTSPIWTFWAQGFDDAPSLIQTCRKSLKKYCGTHPVIELDLTNLSDYIQIPDCVSLALNSGAMGLACFSDFVRFSLLSQYGGIWADSTCYFTGVIPDELTLFSFYSIHQKMNSQRYVSQGRWAAWFLASGPSNQLLSECYRAYIAYWQNHNSLIDYFLVDYLFELTCRRCPKAASQINHVPFYCGDPKLLRRLLVDEYIGSIDLGHLDGGFIQKLNHRDVIAVSKLNLLNSFN